MSTTANVNTNANTEPSFKVGGSQANVKKSFKMYRHNSTTDKSLVLADYITAKPKESTITFLTRIENDASELSKRIFGSILFTRCKSVAAHYVVVDVDDDGFTKKRSVDVQVCISQIPDMRIHPNFPKILLQRLAADARHNAENNVVSLHIRYIGCKPKADGEVIMSAAE